MTSSNYTKEELDAIRNEMRMANEEAARVAKERGYEIDPRIKAANLK